MRACICHVGWQSVCYSDMHTVEIRHCAREIAVPRSRVKLNNLLLEGDVTLSICLSVCLFFSEISLTNKQSMACKAQLV